MGHTTTLNSCYVTPEHLISLRKFRALNFTVEPALNSSTIVIAKRDKGNDILIHLKVLTSCIGKLDV